VPPGQQWVPQQPVQQGQPAFAVVALVTGILGLLTSLCWCLGLPLCVAAIVFGILGRRQAIERGFSPAMATAGLVMGIVGVAIALIFLIIGVATTNFNDIRTGS
jgi:hypothetical protein